MRAAARRQQALQQAALQQAMARVLFTAPAVVDSVTAGAASDGLPLVTVTRNGTSFPAAYPDHLTFEVGQQVVLLVSEGSPPLILCRPGGTP